MGGLMRLLLLPEGYAVCRLGPAAEAPSWGAGASLWSLTRTPDETSLVCAESGLPADTGAVVVSRGWRALRVAGSMDLSIVGVMAQLSSALAAVGVAIFVIATYDTDYLLVRADDLEKAAAALEAAGHTV
jgi:hypothetical protein